MGLKEKLTGVNIWRSVIGVFLAAALAAGAWVFAEVRDMPKNYVQHRDITTITSIMNKLDKKVDSIGNFIRDLPEKFPYKEDVQRKDNALERKLNRLEDKLDDLIMMELDKESKKGVKDKFAHGGYDKDSK